VFHSLDRRIESHMTFKELPRSCMPRGAPHQSAAARVDPTGRRGGAFRDSHRRVEETRHGQAVTILRYTASGRRARHSSSYVEAQMQGERRRAHSEHRWAI